MSSSGHPPGRSLFHPGAPPAMLPPVGTDGAADMRRPILALCLLAGLLAACTRPLSDREAAFAGALFGDSLDPAEVRVTQGLGLAPLVRTKVAATYRVDPPEGACVRTPSPVRPPPRAFALANRVHFTTDLYSSDMMAGWPDGLRVPHALTMAHELVHVWQWQNRARTGYRPWRAAAESLRIADPYFYGATGEFARLGYEQQAALVEDWLCFAVLDPGNPRKAELEETLAPVFPLGRVEAALRR